MPVGQAVTKFPLNATVCVFVTVSSQDSPASPVLQLQYPFMQMPFPLH